MLDERAARSALRRQSISIAVAVVPFALAFGVSCAEADLTVGEAVGFSALVFTGAAQFAAVRVLSDGGAPAAAIATAVLLSLRLLAYGVVMAPVISGPRWWRALASHFMLDETMAAGASQPTRRMQREAYFLCGGLIFVLWNAGTVVGVLAGSNAGDLVETWGLDATIPAAFLALLWPRLADRRQRAVAAVGAVIALVLVPIAPAGLPILGASAGVFAARAVPQLPPGPAPTPDVAG